MQHKVIFYSLNYAGNYSEHYVHEKGYDKTFLEKEIIDNLTFFSDNILAIFKIWYGINA